MNFLTKNYLKALQFALCLGSFALPGCILGGFCGAAPNQTEIVVYPTDAATGAPIRSPSFTDQGVTVSPSCSQSSPTDDTLCMAQLLVVDPGVHMITISAPGYQAQTVSVDTQANDSAHLAVQLSAAP